MTVDSSKPGVVNNNGTISVGLNTWTGDTYNFTGGKVDSLGVDGGTINITGGQVDFTGKMINNGGDADIKVTISGSATVINPHIYVYDKNDCDKKLSVKVNGTPAISGLTYSTFGQPLEVPSLVLNGGYYDKDPASFAGNYVSAAYDANTVDTLYVNYNGSYVLYGDLDDTVKSYFDANDNYYTYDTNANAAYITLSNTPEVYSGQSWAANSAVYKWRIVGTAIPVSGISLNKSVLNLAKGASDTLTATVSPMDATDKSVTWKTSNAAVATVSAGKVTAVGAGKATITATAGGKSATCEVTVTATTDKSVGEKVTDKSSKAKYEVTSNDASAPTVAYKATTATSAKTISVPATVKINGKTYKVTSVAKNAFKGNKKVTKVTIGANVTSIGDGAFSGCSKLTTVTVAKNVDKLGSGVFSGCKKLKTLTIKSTKLADKNVNKKAFKGITKKTTIKVPKSKLKAYKTLFRKKGLAKNVKVKK
ncbi:MAG: leucine-rich repeat protein [Lachnospiraceae bacterium]|nr:leucine-rich repeat protein [Lachnospiraceae bacterium]